jgi:ABC-type dipeptide/oligopeptide/nickel transport system permease subunit
VSGTSDSALRGALRRTPITVEVVFGLTVVSIICLAALLAPLIAPKDPYFIDIAHRAAPPGTPGFPLGADELGRDILSRLIVGSRTSLLTALLPTAISLIVGCVAGMLAGFWRGWLDGVLMRVMDVFLAFPTVLLALGIAAALGPSLASVLIAMTLVGVPSYARLMRASVLAAREEQFVESARSVGVRARRIMARHILPFVISPVVVYSTLQLGRNVILASGLSFLGLGVQSPLADWGAMLSSGRSLMVQAPHIATIPGLAIFALSIGFNLLGDGLRDLLDPRTKR